MRKSYAQALRSLARHAARCRRKHEAMQFNNCSLQRRGLMGFCANGHVCKEKKLKLDMARGRYYLMQASKVLRGWGLVSHRIAYGRQQVCPEIQPSARGWQHCSLKILLRPSEDFGKNAAVSLARN